MKGIEIREMAMDRISVQSGNIRSVGYDAASSTLEIEFKSRSIYQYLNVPESEFENLMNATSKGRYLNQNIKDCYRYIQVK